MRYQSVPPAVHMFNLIVIMKVCFGEKEGPLTTSLLRLNYRPANSARLRMRMSIMLLR